MSLQDDLAASLAAIAAATTALNTVGGQATAAINQVSKAYSDRIAGLSVGFHVNQTTGLDTAAGTVDAPLRSFKEALRRTPPGGVCLAFLQSDYNQSEALAINARSLRIISTSSVRRSLTYDRSVNTADSPASREVAGYYLTGNASLSFNQCRIVHPALDGYGSNPNNGNGCLFRGSYFETGAVSVSLYNCDFNLSNTPFAPLFLDSMCIDFAPVSVTMVGAATSFNGKVIGSQTSTAGVASSSISYLRSTLSTI